MKFSYQDLAGNNVEVECESYTHIPSGTATKSTEGGNYHLNENFSFFKKTEADSMPIYRFAIDRNSNVFNSDELPALAQIGTDWKNLD
ncbi:hypothetical protein ODQ17_15360 [Acinetobacter sp. IRS14]|uniref:hypothetical protein n=1 Tax=Acinetobacter TaxID=469 RepID=UPI00061E0616|nr:MULTISPECIES: hypothetical protein [Acinetobacter]MCG6039387.1 hypothetical protein [Acinetobacter baumannii]KKC44965.1 hypothetical protein UC75_05425 [Acinetobacter sp. V2]MBJ9739043.1 hypothetical protein [Acinetobacter oleivorans]MCU4410453.1 hypothetical protein [Acinetobacter oleivorans]MEA1230752.1 hypothetical protein [Acinetobacter sp. IRS14]